MPNDSEKNYQDIPTASFKPIGEVQSQQEELIKNYEASKNEELTQPINYSNQVKVLEQKLNKKKYSMPLLGVLVIVICVNIAWIIGVHLFIVPKYEKYVSQSEEIWENYSTLKRRVDAIVGE